MSIKLSYSNIAWTADQDDTVYEILKNHKFDGVEIAPTRIYPEEPYSKEHIKGIGEYAKKLQENHALSISSLQSIWYGRKEKIFSDAMEQDALIEYTKRAAEFAKAAGAGNLVFGCPFNRNIEREDAALEQRFYEGIQRGLEGGGVFFALEAVSSVYNTNYLNTTQSVLEKAEQLRNIGLKNIAVNLDLGTMLSEESSADILKGKVHLISHVHISEPGLRTIEKRSIHQEVIEVLKEEGYNRFVSVEMGKGASLSEIEEIAGYVSAIIET